MRVNKTAKVQHNLFKHSAILSSHESIATIRSSHPRCFIKEGVLKNFTQFTGKYLCWSLFSNDVADMRFATLFKKRLQHFPVNFVKFLRNRFYKTPPGDCFQTLPWTEAAVEKCSVKMVFLKISQNSQENTVAEVSISKSCWLSALLLKKRLRHRFLHACGF